MRLFWEAADADNFDELLCQVPDGVLDSPRRSVVPLLDFCRDPMVALRRLSESTGMSLTAATEMRFEYPVPVQQGRGKPSFTDLLIVTPGAILGVEAKYTEPPYETVRTWLRKPPDHNRSAVLSGWLELLNRVSARKLSIGDVLDLPYQLIHRTASACYPDCDERGVAYLVFTDAVARYTEHMAFLARLIGDALILQVLSCPVEKQPSLVDLERAWDRGERKLSRAVRAALSAGPLFTFPRVRVAYANRPALTL